MQFTDSAPVGLAHPAAAAAATSHAASKDIAPDQQRNGDSSASEISVCISQLTGSANRKAPLVSIISPESAKSFLQLHLLQIVHFLFIMLQLGCALAVILLVKLHLAVYTLRGDASSAQWVSYYCFAAPAAWQGTCDVAYALAALSIFFCLVLSMMQCLHMDCCGGGRVAETIFDLLLLIEWIAASVMFGQRASEANALSLPRMEARNAVAAMAAVSAFNALVLLLTNGVLLWKLGRSYKVAHTEDPDWPNLPSGPHHFHHPTVLAGTTKHW